MANQDIQIDINLAVNSAVAELKKLNEQTKKSQTSFSSLGKNIIIANQGLQLASKGFNAISGFLGSFIDKAKSLEQTTIQFEVLTKSATKAANIIKDLQNFAATTPFQFPGIADAAKQLLAFGFAQDQIIPKLKQIGDVAAGSGASLKEVSLIYGQVGAAGKLTGERLLQFQERAIPIAPAIAKAMGITEKEVKDAVSAGKVDLKIFESAFASLSSESGLFYEGMIKQSKTLGGVLSTLGDNVELVQSDIGAAFLPAIKGVTIAIIDLIQKNRELIKSFIENNGAVIMATAINILAGSIKGLNFLFVGLTSTLDFLKLGISYFLTAIISTIQVVIQAKKAVKEFIGANTEAEESTLSLLSGMKLAAEDERAEIDLTLQKRQAESEARIEMIDLVTQKITEASEARAEAVENGAAREQTAISNAQSSNMIFLADWKKELGKQKSFEEMTSKERIANQRSTFAQIATLSESNNKALSAIGKGAAITTATIDGIVAVQKALAAFPPPYNFIAAGLVGAAASTNVAKISGVPLAEGGLVMPRPGGVQATIAEAGKPEIVIPLDDKRAQNAVGGLGGTNVYVTIQGNVIGTDENIEQLAQQLSDAVEFRNVRLLAS